MKAVKFEVSGDCPDIGKFTKDEIREIPGNIADIQIARGVCVVAEMPAADNQEVEDNG